MHLQYDATRVDAFSLGCVALELALGDEWFCGEWLSAYQRFDRQRDPGYWSLVSELAAKKEEALRQLAYDELHAAGRAQPLDRDGPPSFAASPPSERRRAPDETNATLPAINRPVAETGGLTGAETTEAASYAGLRDFLARTLEFTPSERLTSSSAPRHAWLSPR